MRNLWAASENLGLNPGWSFWFQFLLIVTAGYPCGRLQLGVHGPALVLSALVWHWQVNPHMRSRSLPLCTTFPICLSFFVSQVNTFLKTNKAGTLKFLSYQNHIHSSKCFGKLEIVSFTTSQDFSNKISFYPQRKKIYFIAIILITPQKSYWENSPPLTHTTR